MAHTLQTKGFLRLCPEAAMPSSSHAVCTLQVHALTSPCLALSAGAEAISKKMLRQVTSQAEC